MGTTLVGRIAAVSLLMLVWAPAPAQAVGQLTVIAKIGVAGMLSVFFSETGPLDAAIEAIYADKIKPELDCDPAPCRLVAAYRIAARPIVPAHRPRASLANLQARFDGPVSRTTLSLYQAVIDRETMVAADERAVFETVCRRYTAQVRRDSAASARQEAARTRLVAATLASKQAANAAWRALLDHLVRAGIVHRPLPALETFLARFRAQGFPREEIAILRGFGLRKDEIAFLRREITAKFDPATAPRTFEAIAAQAISVNDYNEDIASCACAAPK